MYYVCLCFCNLQALKDDTELENYAGKNSDFLNFPDVKTEVDSSEEESVGKTVIIRPSNKPLVRVVSR